MAVVGSVGVATGGFVGPVVGQESVRSVGLVMGAVAVGRLAVGREVGTLLVGSAVGGWRRPEGEQVTKCSIIYGWIFTTLPLH